MNQFQSMGMQPSPFKGFLVRLLAAILDTVIIIIAVFGAAFTLGIFFGSLLGEGAGLGIFFLALILSPLVTLLYKPLMEASDYQGTFGKHILNIKVVDKNGRRISMTKSFIRSIIYLLLISIPFLNMISWVAFLMIIFSEEKQGLHDIPAETYVVSKYWQGPVPLQDKFGV